MPTNETEETVDVPLDTDQLFIHTKRPQWGVAMVTWEGNDRRRYQFQDGLLRTFKEGFFHLFEAIDASAAAQATLREDLQRKHGLALVDRQAEKSNEKVRPVMSFADQVRVFRHDYPEGFQDEDYTTTWRSREDTTRLKRLVDPVIALAQERLGQPVLEQLIAEEDWAAVHDGMLSILKRTSLASPSRVVVPLEDLQAEYLPRIVHALHALLYGDDELDRRFREWVMALDCEGKNAVNWPMATVLPALVCPDAHLCVRLKAVRLQARSIDPDARAGRHPSPLGYTRALRVAEKTRKALIEDHGLKPRDLVDVRQFMWQTLRPKAQQTISDLRTPGL